MLNPPGVHLNFWKRGLSNVPDAVWNQPEAETLVLAENGLREISEKLGALAKLRMLDLGHNEITANRRRSAILRV